MELDRKKITRTFWMAVRQRFLPALCIGALFAALAPNTQGAFMGDYALGNFTLTNTEADGSANIDSAGALILTGGNNGSGLEGKTELTIQAAGSGMVTFDYSYTTLDDPQFDLAGYLLGTAFTLLADSNGDSGSVSFPVTLGQTFGFGITTSDNTHEPGILIISGFNAPGTSSTVIPEPYTGLLILVALSAMAARRLSGRIRLRMVQPPAAGRWLACAAVALAVSSPLAAQQSTNYVGTNVTGQLVLARTVNLLQQAQDMPMFALRLAPKPETKPKQPQKRLRPPVISPVTSKSAKSFAAAAITPSLVVTPGWAGSGFAGLTHFDQRMANNGNQFSVEPPNPSLAVGKGFVLEGVNNAVQVYTTAGVAMLPKPLSSNEVFGVPAAIDRITDINGVFPTDMRVFYDHPSDRWYILQRAQDNDIFGAPRPSSRIYLAVSQTSNPVGTYNIYEMVTTDSANPGCPCFADYPQIGADQYGFYISSNEYHWLSESFVNAQIHAVSKAALAAGAQTPPVMRFLLPMTTGYEFALQPATTPPGASYFQAAGGLVFFVSSHGRFASDSNLSVWAMYNTASLAAGAPALTLTQRRISTLSYISPDVAVQRPGPLPYGSTLSPPGRLSFIEGGDTRVLSVSYAAGRLFVTLGSQVTDENLRSVVGAAFVILSPTFRGGVLAVSVLRQGLLSVKNNHLLFPSVAVNAQGRGAIAFTLVGPDYFPSSAFVPINSFATSTAIQVPALGAFPQDGFTGYPDFGGVGVARWGDYSAAFADSDGSIWMTAEYIPKGDRTEFANWGTFIARYLP